MKPIRTIIVLAAALLSISAVVGSAAGAAATRQFEGTVVSVNREAKTFRLHDAERGTVRIKVTRHTRFERIGGLAGLKAGAKRIEATVKRKNGAWIALSVERSGGGGEHGGGGGDGGGDDDDAGDDHGGR
jgi:uncharacterized membrane protein YgcG